MRSDLQVQAEKVMLGWKAPLPSPEGMIRKARSMTVFRYFFWGEDIDISDHDVDCMMKHDGLSYFLKILTYLLELE